MDLLNRTGFAVLTLALAPLYGADEYAVKAAFVYNFTKFVEWPAGSLVADEPLVICVQGRSPIAAAIEAAAGGKKSAGHPLEVRTVDGPRQVGGCKLLYVPADEHKAATILSSARGQGILTVGEADEFLSRGGIIHLRLAGGRVRMSVDVKEAERSGLRISSRLLSLAEIAK